MKGYKMLAHVSDGGVVFLYVFALSVQEVPYVWTSKLWTFADVNMHLHAQSHC